MQERSAIVQTPRPDVVLIQDGALFQGGSPTPTEVLAGFRAKRDELLEQLETLEDRREDIESDLREGNFTDATRPGLEARIAEIDKRILATEVQIAQADAEVAAAAAVPGAAIPEPEPPIYERAGPSEEVVMLGLVVSGVLLLPVTLAWARRIWRRSAQVVTAWPRELADRFSRLEHAVDSIAVEVERIGEGQRFMTRVLGEHGVPREALPQSLTDELNLPPDTSSRRR